MANVAMLLGYALVRQPPLTPLQLAGSLQRQAPSRRALGSLGLLGPVATARGLGSINSAMVVEPMQVGPLCEAPSPRPT